MLKLWNLQDKSRIEFYNLQIYDILRSEIAHWNSLSTVFHAQVAHSTPMKPAPTTSTVDCFLFKSLSFWYSWKWLGQYGQLAANNLVSCAPCAKDLPYLGYPSTFVMESDKMSTV